MLNAWAVGSGQWAVGSGQSHGYRVYQAHGMVCVQADCSLVEALVLMQNSADATVFGSRRRRAGSR